MSIKHLLIILFCIFGANLNAQWEYVNPYPWGAHIYDINVTTEGTLVGVNNDINDVIITTDGGAVWTVFPQSANMNLRTLSFVNANTGYGVGGGPFSKPWRTTNGGYSWTELTSAPDTTKYDVAFFDANTGWAVGNNNFIIKTTNGGITWISQTAHYLPNRLLRGVAALSPNIVIAVGDSNCIIRSTNGGTNFFTVPTPLMGSYSVYPFHDIKFGDSNTGWIVGRPRTILKTTNGGNSWDSVYSSSSGTLISVDASLNTVAACGSGNSFLRSTDYGSTWRSNFGPIIYSGDTLLSVQCESNNVIYVSGKNGLLMKTYNLGVNWISLTTYDAGYYYDNIRGIGFGSNDTGYVLAVQNTCCSRIYRTINGGANFDKYEHYIGVPMWDISVPSANRVYSVGEKGTIVYTSNWISWTITFPTNTTDEFYSVSFINDYTGWVSGSNGVVLKTTNGAANWTNFSISGAGDLRSIEFTDENHGWCVGTGRTVYFTTNGGNNWSTIQFDTSQLTNVNDLNFINQMTGFVGGGYGKVLKTTNGGFNWIQSAYLGFHINIIDFYDAENGVVAGQHGYIYRTTNGGLSWIADSRKTTNSFWCSSISPNGTQYLGSSNGVIIKSNNIPTSLTQETGNVPNRFSLSSNYPNPFNPLTKIRIEIPKREAVVLKVYNIQGKHIATLVNGVQNAGVYEVVFDGSNYSSGVYFYRLESADFVQTKKMVLIK